MKKARVIQKDSDQPDVDLYTLKKFCSECEYNGNLSLPSEISSYAKVFLVGEAPAREEFEKERNFVGDSGHLLTRYLREIGHHRRDVHIGNIIRCKIPSKLSRTDKDSLIKRLSACCGRYILDDIKRAKPTIVVLMGKPAIHFFIKGSPSVTKVRGRIFYSELAQTHIICTYHPAAVMRDWTYEKSIVHDLEKAFAFVENPNIEVKEPTYKIARGLEDSLHICEFLRNQDEIVFDVETDSLDWLDGDILSFGFSHKPFSGVTIPFRSIHSTPLNAKERTKLVNHGIKPLLECPNKKIGHNILFDCHWAKNYDITVNNVTFDTMLAHHLIDENFPLDLDTLADFYTDMGTYADELYAHLPSKKSSYNVVPDEVLWIYGAKDCDAEFRLKTIFDEKLDKEGVRWVFDNITVPLIDVILEIERRGVYVDRDGFEAAAIEAGEELDRLTEEMRTHSGMGDDFNPNSTKQLQDILFNTLILTPVRETKTGYSTDVKTLEALEGQHEFVDLLQTYRKLAKFKGTYLDGTRDGKEAGLIRRIREDGRIHTSYKIHGTGTGRLSSAAPNLQNIPRGALIRALFKAAPGCKFVIADFERGEMFTSAHLSRDVQLQRALREDIHRALAARMYNKKREDVTKEERVAAKTVIFGIQYGRGPDSLAKQLKISRAEAIRYIVAFFDSYTQLEAWIKRQHDHVRRYGFVRNLFGRKRHLYGIFSVQNSYTRGEILRQAQNSPVQGSLADAGHLATIELVKRLKEDFSDVDIGVVLLVHDEIVLEVPEAYVEPVKALLKEVFEKPRKGLQIPVEILVGDNWSAK